MQRYGTTECSKKIKTGGREPGRVKVLRPGKKGSGRRKQSHNMKGWKAVDKEHNRGRKEA